MQKYFEYGEKETDYLKKRDKKLAELIEKFGHINFKCHDDLFSGIVFTIIGQQISTKAQDAVWGRVKNCINPVTPETIINAGVETLRLCGVSYRKAEYITNCALKVRAKEIDFEHIKNMTDDDAIKELTKLKGVGIWTAEILLLLCQMRKNIFSYNDLGIQNGLKLIYRHKKMSKKLFEKYRKRFSPYCSVASLYIWAANNQSD